MDKERALRMAAHIFKLAELLKEEINDNMSLPPSPSTPKQLESLEKKNEDLDRRKQAEYATEVNSELHGNNLEELLRQSINEVERRKKEKEEDS